MGTSEVTLALVVYGLFALLTAVGAFFAVASWRGRAAGIVAASLALLFFAALLTGLWLLLGVSE